METSSPPALVRHTFFLPEAGEWWLPAEFQDRTLYRFCHASHALSVIQIELGELGPEFAAAWLRNRRQRLLGSGLVEATEPERFDNDELGIEGFFLEPHQPGVRPQAMLVVATQPHLATLMVEHAAGSAGLTHAFAERIALREKPPEPTPGWHHRLVGAAWVPVPDGATDPTCVNYADERISLSLQGYGTSAPLELADTDVPLVVEPPLLGKTTQGLPLEIIVGEGRDIMGEAVLAASAVVRAMPSSLLLQAYAEGAQCAELRLHLPSIAASIHMTGLVSP